MRQLGRPLRNAARRPAAGRSSRRFATSWTGGGLDRAAAEGEAAGAASTPSQKIGYMVGKWQIMRLLGRYRDKQGSNFRLGAFHDQLISYGSLPLSVIEWLMFDDPTTLAAVNGDKKGDVP